ncbi:MAG: terminase large subunit domain-containing protein [Anaeroplasma sp.]
MKKNTITPQEGFQEKFVRTNVDFCVGGGVLNSLPLDAKVLTPSGFKAMRNIQVGDIVCDADGGTQTVNVIVKKGVLTCAKFILEDGRTVESSLDHRWKVYDNENNILDITTEEILDYYNENNNTQYSIPTITPHCGYDDENYLRGIDPYLLGVFLSKGVINKDSKLPYFYSFDNKLISTLTAKYPYFKYETNDSKKIKCIFNDLKLKKYLIKFGIYDGKKTIPSYYMYAPKNVRVSILQGIFDTVGKIYTTQYNKSFYSINSINQEFINTIKELVYSLGGKCYVSHYNPKADKTKDAIFHLNIILKDIELLTHNVQPFIPCKSDDRIKIKKCIITGNKECQCINVSGDEHLFITDGYIITRNCGKAQPLNAKILTPNGYVTMGSLKVGDVICDTEGGEQIVEAIFPQGAKRCYRITLNDGSQVECSANHLWKVYDVKKKDYQILTLKEISKNKDIYRIPFVTSVKFNKKKVLIPPYIFALILFCGCLTNGKVVIYTKNSNIITELSRHKITFKLVYSRHWGYYIQIQDNTINEYFKTHNLLQLENKEGKYIPEEYIYNCFKYRVDFIKAVFDFASVIDTQRPRVKTRIKNKKILEDLQIIIKSLGGSARIYNAPNGSYVLLSKIKDPQKYFTYKECKDRLKYKPEQIKKLKIVSIDYLGMDEMQCIRVSHPNHLYITNGLTVTHNTFAAVLSIAEPSQDSRFRALFLRNNLGDARASGGIIDTFKSIYNEDIDVVESGEPRVTFKDSGAKVDITHVADQSRDKVLQRFKGRQYDFIYFDEGTGFTWECFTAIYTRNRGTANWTGKVRMTTNPDKNHWLRKFLDWYIGIDGFINPEREGVVRYFYLNGERVEDVIWGDTKEEVYEQCKITIDRTLAKINGRNGNATYKDIIKSFTFYLGKMSENKASLSHNSSYIGSVAVMGGRNAQQLLEGNWNVSPDENLNAMITSYDAMTVFENDPQVNGDMWITADLADTGTDNFIALVWNGFHIIDILIKNRTKPVDNANFLLNLAVQYNIPNNRIIFDAIRGIYIKDYIPEAIAYTSYSTPIGMYSRMCYNLKAECFMRLVNAIKRRYLSMSEKVANTIYTHLNLSERITVANEFVEECMVIAFREMPNGKKALFGKKEMNQNLGKNRSMDLTDPISMRFYPVLKYCYGEELIMTSVNNAFSTKQEEEYVNNIYDDSIWA